VAKRGRPEGSLIRLLDDPGRFEIAAWFAFVSLLQMKPHPAAKLVTFLFLESEEAPTTESVGGFFLQTKIKLRRENRDGGAKGHAKALVRKAKVAIARADERELRWLTYSSRLIAALVKYMAEGNPNGASATLHLLRAAAGWAEAADRVIARISEAVRGDFPPAEGPLSKRARRLLLKMQLHPQ
jgi:hypothetical protein